MAGTPYMSLTLPAPTVTVGPDWASQIVTALQTIDAHDHTSGKGAALSSTALNVTADLPFNAHSLTGLLSSEYSDQGSALSASVHKSAIYSKGGDLWWNDQAGNQIRITASGAVNLGASGSIGGMDGSAAVTYAAASKLFTFTQSSNFPAKVAHGDLLLYETTSGASQALTLKVPAGFASAYSLTFPAALPAGNALLLVSNTGVLSYVTQPTLTGVTLTGAAALATPSAGSAVLAALSTDGWGDAKSAAYTLNEAGTRYEFGGVGGNNHGAVGLDITGSGNALASRSSTGAAASFVIPANALSQNGKRYRVFFYIDTNAATFQGTVEVRLDTVALDSVVMNGTAGLSGYVEILRLSATTAIENIIWNPNAAGGARGTCGITAVANWTAGRNVDVNIASYTGGTLRAILSGEKVG